MYQCRFINFYKCTILVGCWQWGKLGMCGARGLLEISALPFQFCCEPKLVLKYKFFLKKYNAMCIYIYIFALKTLFLKDFGTLILLLLIVSYKILALLQFKTSLWFSFIFWIYPIGHPKSKYFIVIWVDFLYITYIVLVYNYSWHLYMFWLAFILKYLSKDAFMADRFGRKK